MPRGFYKKTGVPIQLGKKCTKETKEKMSKIRKGRKRPPFSEEWKKKLSEARRNISQETRQRMSLAKKWKPRPQQIGEKNYFWKGGVTPINKKIRMSLDFSLWRKAIFERDNFTCQKCKVNGGDLHPHHIHNFADYPEIRFALDNGITLCEFCHRNFHKKYGNINNTKEQLEEYLIT